MTEPYPDVVARFYDAVYAQVRDGVDNEWYLARMAEADGPTLEIGVGTGRLFAEARRRGLDVSAEDLTHVLLADSHRYAGLKACFPVRDLFGAVAGRVGERTARASLASDIYFARYRAGSRGSPRRLQSRH